MKCKKCGVENPQSAKFCRICGNPIESASLDAIIFNLKEYTAIISRKLYEIINNLKGKFSPKQKVSKAFTLDVFKNIQLQPISITNISFIH